MADLFADGDLHFQLARVLKAHWLFDLGCDGKSNQAACACGFPGFPRVANVGEAVDTFVNHTLEEMRPYLAAFASRDPEAAKLEMLVEAARAAFDLLVASRAEGKGPTHAEASLRLALANFRGDAALGAANTPEQQT